MTSGAHLYCCEDFMKSEAHMGELSQHHFRRWQRHANMVAECPEQTLRRLRNTF